MAAKKTTPTAVSVAGFVEALKDLDSRTDSKAHIALMKKAACEKLTIRGPRCGAFY